MTIGSRRCESCGDLIKFPVSEKDASGEMVIKCRSCECWSDFKKQQRAMYLTPRQRAKLKLG